MGLVLDGEGFVLTHRVFPGNINDSKGICSIYAAASVLWWCWTVASPAPDLRFAGH